MKTCDFLKQLNSFQDAAVSTIVNANHNHIIVKGNVFTGKTMIASKLYNSTKELVIYHTGCNPRYYDQSLKKFLNVLDKYDNCLIILDEYYSNELIKYIVKKNYRCIILTNDKNLNFDKFYDFNYCVFYEKFINNLYNKYLNIHEIVQSKKNYQNMRNLRRVSSNTMIKIKNNKKERVYKMEFKNDNTNS